MESVWVGLVQKDLESICPVWFWAKIADGPGSLPGFKLVDMNEL